MTTTQLTNAIATALSHHLPNIPIHPVTGAVPPESQGVTYRLLAAKLTRERSDRFVQSHIYEIRWLDGNNIPEDLPDKLFEALETIEVEGTPYRATELRWKTWGEIPKLWVYYTMRTTKVSESSGPMQMLEQRPTALKST
ncbi:phage tail terminator family protein [Paenibacillus amylolyticus]|uniref:phage tail terminator family protein n=1 Tax=Paenibacillus amylolyticus TaxID=1451 RepID=UPI003EBB5F21